MRVAEDPSPAHLPAAWLRLDGVDAAFTGCWPVLQASRRFDAAQGRHTRLTLQRD